MQPAPTGQPSLEQIKQKMRSVWMAGDFGQIARYSAKSAEEFVDRLNIQPGMRVLDVACGSGNLAIPAARKGAQVSGVDIAPNLLEQAKQRAAAEGLKATFDEGDAEQMSYPDAGFDVVMSMFGAMFASRRSLPESAVRVESSRWQTGRCRGSSGSCSSWVIVTCHRRRGYPLPCCGASRTSCGSGWAPIRPRSG